jgi:hypothetical protein
MTSSGDILASLNNQRNPFVLLSIYVIDRSTRLKVQRHPTTVFQSLELALCTILVVTLAPLPLGSNSLRQMKPDLISFTD